MTWTIYFQMRRYNSQRDLNDSIAPISSQLGLVWRIVLARSWHGARTVRP